MLGLRRFDVSGLLRSALVVLLFIVGVVVLSVCSDGLGVGCDHPCCASADRSRSVRRLVHGTSSARQSIIEALLVSLERAVTGMAASCVALASDQLMLKVPPLRI